MKLYSRACIVLRPAMDLFWVAFILATLVGLVRWALGSKMIIRAALRAVRAGGPIPRHVACIMDGNRRWARNAKLEVHQGHARGGEKLTELLEWCMEAGVKVVTVYAFSIENFKRPKREVDEIMKLCELKFREFLEKSQVVHRNRVQVRLLGDLSRVPSSLRPLLNRVMKSTMEYSDGPVLNLCFSYACRYDIACSVANVVRMCDSGEINEIDVTDGLVASTLATGFANGAEEGAPYPELLIRTSGETRLSDFLLWEGCFSVLSFCDSLWPDLSVWDFVKLLIDYQRRNRYRSGTLTSFKKSLDCETLDSGWNLHGYSERTGTALRRLRAILTLTGLESRFQQCQDTSTKHRHNVTHKKAPHVAIENGKSVVGLGQALRKSVPPIESENISSLK